MSSISSRILDSFPVSWGLVSSEETGKNKGTGTHKKSVKGIPDLPFRCFPQNLAGALSVAALNGNMEHMVGAADATAAAWRLHAFELLTTLAVEGTSIFFGVLAFAFGCLLAFVERHFVLEADEKVEHCELNCSAAAALEFDCA